MSRFQRLRWLAWEIVGLWLFEKSVGCWMRMTALADQGPKNSGLTFLQDHTGVILASRCLTASVDLLHKGYDRQYPKEKQA